MEVSDYTFKCPMGDIKVKKVGHSSGIIIAYNCWDEIVASCYCKAANAEIPSDKTLELCVSCKAETYKACKYYAQGIDPLKK